MSERRLLLVHAHPDDESITTGATMAKYVAEGAQVTLVTCTAGEEGEILLDEFAHLAADREDGLGEVRKTELAAAMTELGVTDHRFLGGFGRFRDSGMQWSEAAMAIPRDDTREDTFWAADLTEAATELVSVIRETRPQVMVTYDEFGGYGHPDHIQAHRVAMYAASLAAARSYRPDLGQPWEIQKIYWTAMSASAMRAGLQRLRDSGDTTTFDWMEPDRLPPGAVEDEFLDAVIEAENHLEAKNAALRAHATQISVDGPFFALSNNVGAKIFGTEYFRLVKGTRGADIETDLFAGLN